MGFFIDEASIQVISGKGGKGCISFRREKFVAFGGPNGGNGGKGGDVVMVALNNVHTLSSVRAKFRYAASNGQGGSSSNKTGASGQDLVIEVPLGTLIKDKDTGFVLADLTKANERFIVAKGGQGGRGNSSFKGPINQAPRYAEEGREGQFKNLLLELKVMADVGLVGFPNAGKSTLISKVSNATPEIASYPFTTLTPHLGVVEINGMLGEKFVMADIPGIIEGAHQGKGLGLRFLKHIERTKVLLFVIDIFDENPVNTYQTLNSELKNYGKNLEKKPFLIALNKIDNFLEQEEALKIQKDFIKQTKVLKDKVFMISGLKKQGLEELKKALYQTITLFNQESL